jgi:hypothetical protein
MSKKEAREEMGEETKGGVGSELERTQPVHREEMEGGG